MADCHLHRGRVRIKPIPASVPRALVNPAINTPTDEGRTPRPDRDAAAKCVLLLGGVSHEILNANPNSAVLILHTNRA
jgi:hypothetical protein